MDDFCWWCKRLVIQEGAILVAPFTLGDPDICDHPNSGGEHESTNDIVEGAERYRATALRRPTSAELDELIQLARDLGD